MKIDKTQSVWYKRYFPQRVQDIVLPKDLKAQLQDYVNNETIPHLGLFSSIAGTGKSSTANAIITELGCEALWINASMQRGIDTLKGRVETFATQSSFDDKIKIVVMDEFDNFSHDGQRAFRGFIDNYSDNCRFIFTGNTKEKIIEPLLNRMEIYDFNSFTKKEMIPDIFNRLKFILTQEGVTFEDKDLVPVINTYYPSVRSMVGALQRFSSDGVFKLSTGDLDNLNAFDNIITLVKKKDFAGVVSKVNELSAPDGMYTFLYNRVQDLFEASKRPSIVLIIAKYQHMNMIVRDRNLNLSACLTEIMMTLK